METRYLSKEMPQPSNFWGSSYWPILRPTRTTATTACIQEERAMHGSRKDRLLASIFTSSHAMPVTSLARSLRKNKDNGADRTTSGRRLRRHGDDAASQFPAQAVAAGRRDSIPAKYKKPRADMAPAARLPEVRFHAAVYLRRSRRRTRGPLSRRAGSDSFGCGSLRHWRSQALPQARAGDRGELPRSGI